MLVHETTSFKQTKLISEHYPHITNRNLQRFRSQKKLQTYIPAVSQTSQLEHLREILVDNQIS